MSTALVLLAVYSGSVVGCRRDAPVTASGGSGGGLAGSSGGTTGGTGNPGAGGTDPDCIAFEPDFGSCGRCEVSLDRYCQTHICRMPTPIGECYIVNQGHRLMTRGCGYLRFQRWIGFDESAPLRGSEVWNEVTGELVYRYERSFYDDACIPDVVTGVEPAPCPETIVICDNAHTCTFPPHEQCPGPCYTKCQDPEDTTSCEEYEAMMCPDGQGGAGGEGGFGGDAP
jgi:hypothetical protein